MIYVVRIISVEVDGFLREIQIDSEGTFLDLANAVLDSCEFPDDQLTSFFLCNDEWQRGIEITREDMGGTSADIDVYVMDDTHISELIDDAGQRLEFVFDPFADRSLAMEVVSVVPGKRLLEPFCSARKGNPPTQIEQIDLDFRPTPPPGKGAPIPVEDDIEDFYGDSDFNADEFDPEGFEISEE